MLILSDNVIVFVYRYYHRRRQYNLFFCVAGIMAVPTLFFVKLSDNAYPPVSYTHLDVYKRQPLRGSSYIPLSPKLTAKKSIINPKNTDNYLSLIHI